MKNRLDDLEKRTRELEHRVTVLEKGQNTKTTIQMKKKKTLSMREFLLQIPQKSKVEKALAIGYYLEEFENMESFNVADLEVGFRSAKEQVPTNINDMVNKNINKGYMMEAKEKRDNKKAWVLTSSGEKFIKDNLKEEAN